jgi:AGCS family alanine or glycine:cation symporter
LVYLLVACHIFFCFKTKFVQRHAIKGVKYTFSPKTSGNTYAAFASALGTTIGPGNITGVGVAISAGGAGAVFWMWLCGLLAMPTKYAESYLSLRYSKDGIGGPMVLLNRFGYKKTAAVWSWLCILAGLFMGAAVPSYALADTVNAPRYITSALLTLCVIITVSFGVSGISKVCSYLVPVMSGAFILLCLLCQCRNGFYCRQQSAASHHGR